jgi:hypothetical protein
MLCCYVIFVDISFFLHPVYASLLSNNNLIPFIKSTLLILYLQGKEGIVKHLYLGILFIYNESESENFGFFSAQCGSCKNIKKQKEMGNSTAENLVCRYCLCACQ